MKKLFLLIGLVTLVACKNTLAPEEKAAAAAKVYYEALAKGDYAQFVDGTQGNDSIADDFRAAQIDGIHRYADQINKKFGGLKAVEVVECTLSETSQEAIVILRLTYSDSVKNRIAVPMVEHNGEWLLK